MNAFSISKSASTEIRRILSQSNCRDPVARLYERADPMNLFDEFKTALRNETKTKEELEAMGKRRFEEVGSQLESSLVVAACDGADLASTDLCEVAGITFVMSLGVSELLRGLCLTFEEGRFVLRGADNVAHTLRSLGTRR